MDKCRLLRGHYRSVWTLGNWCDDECLKMPAELDWQTNGIPSAINNAVMPYCQLYCVFKSVCIMYLVYCICLNVHMHIVSMQCQPVLITMYVRC